MSDAIVGRGHDAVGVTVTPSGDIAIMFKRDSETTGCLLFTQYTSREHFLAEVRPAAVAEGLVRYSELRPWPRSEPEAIEFVREAFMLFAQLNDMQPPQVAKA